MTTIEIKDASGKKAGTADLAASVFGIEPNVAAARSRGARRAPAVPVRAPSAPLSGPAAVPCSARIRVPTRSA